MKKISVAIATFNEETNIEKCLKSVIDWVDEVIIVDGNSIDKTVDIARKYTSKIIVTDNPEIFHINKMKAINICKNDWILQLDADEEVTDKLKEEILSKVGDPLRDNGGNSINGYWIPRKNYFLGKFLSKGGQYPDFTMRLYKKSKGSLPCKSVHEQALIEGKTGYLTYPILHFPYPDFSHYLLHFNTYTDLFSKEIIKNNIRFNFINYCEYFIFKPIFWFILLYFRHKGFQDGFPGFVFSIFSSLRYPVSYIKAWEKIYKQRTK